MEINKPGLNRRRGGGKDPVSETVGRGAGSGWLLMFFSSVTNPFYPALEGRLALEYARSDGKGKTGFAAVGVTGALSA
jgi:hypothetical protein